MLVLTRKLDQEIQIGDQITIKVLSVRGGAVRLGINAPSSVRILRHELAASDAAAERSVPESPTSERSESTPAWTASLARVIPGRPRPSATATAASSSQMAPSQGRKSLAIIASRQRQQRRAARGAGL